MTTGIYGHPGMGLSHHTHYGTAYTRTAGSAGEFTTAMILDGFAGHAAIFHDLTLPGGYGNIDHAVLTGNRLLLIDSKNWAAGRYWNIGKAYFRNWEHRDPPSNALANAHRMVSRHLETEGITLPTPVVALWSGTQSARHGITLNFRGEIIGVPVEKTKTARPFLHYRYPGARVIPGNDLHKTVTRFIGKRPAAPHRGAAATLSTLITK